MGLAVEYEHWWLEPITDKIIPSLSHVLTAVVLHTGVSALDIKAERKPNDILRARQIFCYVARHTTLGSYPKIARAINRDHATIIHAVRRVEMMIARGDGAMRADCEAVRALAEQIALQAEGEGK